MLRVCLKTDLKNINKYIGNNYDKCLYLYLNLKRYGIINDNVLIQQRGTEITALFLFSYNCLHIYSLDNDCNYREIFNLINERKPIIICAEKKIILFLEKKLKTKYLSEYGWVRKLNNKLLEKSFEICSAKPSDLISIAQLLYSNKEITNTYDFDSLYNNIKTRYEQKYSRNYIIKKNGVIIAHAGTGAENKNIAVISYVITREEYRKKGYAKMVVKSLCYDLIKENKNVFLMNYSKESTTLYDKLGFEISCEWGKLYLK